MADREWPETRGGERQPQFRCELGHALYKYPTGAHSHQLLCPFCDQDEVKRWVDAQVKKEGS